MKHKTSELEGVLLDAAVTLAEEGGRLGGWHGLPGQCREYSTDWSDGGPIIEREHIRLDWQPPFGWFAYPWLDMPIDCLPSMDAAATPLIAAMRCYVASKLGEEVEL